MEIIPFCSLGPVSFGDNRDFARDKLAAVYATFAKTPGARLTDAFDGLGLHLYYDDHDQLEFIEAFEPAEITFRGVHFLGRTIPAVTNDLRLLELNIEEADVGIDLPGVGIALYAPTAIVEGVAAYRRGYYKSNCQ